MPIQGRRPVTTGAEHGTLTQQLEIVYSDENSSSKEKAIVASKILATNIFHNEELDKLNISRFNRLMILLFSEGLPSSKFETFITRIACTILFNNMGDKYDESCSDNDEVDDNRETHIKDDGKFVNVKTQEERQLAQKRLAEEKREKEARLEKERAEKAKEEMLAREVAARIAIAQEEVTTRPPSDVVVKNDDPMPLLIRITDRTSGLVEGEEYAQEEVFNLVKDGPADKDNKNNLLSHALDGTIVGFKTLRERLTRREEKNPETVSEEKDNSSLLSELGQALEGTTEELSKAITGLGQALALTKDNAAKRLKGFLQKREALDLTQGVVVQGLS